MFLLALVVIFGISSLNKVNLGFRLFGRSPLRREYKAILLKYSRFYRELEDSRKADFEKRVQYFIRSKSFVPRGIKTVTDEMKVLIAAVAIQLTYGFPNIYLSHFNKILIYPDNYYSTINKLFHQGEVNPLNRLIVLSWNRFMMGMINDNDGINLGLHEMAHALRLENHIRNDEFLFFDQRQLAHWEQLAHEEIIRIRSSEESFFRKYGGTNEEEFFAVAVENFFERPELFRQQRPELYLALGQLLNQIHK